MLSHFFKEGYYIQDSPKQPVRRIIDAGANIGDETARFYCHHPGAEILAIEPEDANFAILRQNFEAHRRVSLLHGGLWSSECYLKLVGAAGGNAESFRVEETDQAQGSVKAYSIPSLLRMMHWEEIDILKLDIEGSEHEVFTRNADSWLGKVKAFIFEVPDNEMPGTTQEIFNRLSGWKFTTTICGENLVLIRGDVPWKAERVVGIAGKKK